MKGFGHLPDRVEHVHEDLDERPAYKLIGSFIRGAIPFVDFSSLVSPRPDQLATSSCVGQALATSLFGRARVAGHPIVPVSAKGLYDVARLIDDPHKALVDQGSRPRAAIIGAKEYGLVAAVRWPLSEADIDKPPPLDVFVHGIGSVLDDYYRIAAGPGAAQLVRQALAKGFLPIFAMNVDASYEEYDGSAVYNGPTGPSLGGHMQCVVGSDNGCLVVANSWSPSWGSNGFSRISDSFFDQGATDILVPTTAPEEAT